VAEDVFIQSGFYTIGFLARESPGHFPG